MSTMSFTLSAIALLAAGAAASLYGESNLNHTCQITNDNAILSCSAGANASLTDSCCAETFGGLLLSTQYWDTYTGLEAQGQLLPQDTWTLHGLWPDFCNGSYTQYCQLDRQYDPSPSPNVTNYPRANTAVPAYNGSLGPTPITSFVQNWGKLDLLSYMQTYWVSQGGTDESFWAHEFSKHGTCYSTFDLPCYGPMYRPGEEVIDFLETALLYYRRLPTWGWLATVGIRPSNTTQYSLSSMQGALTRFYGAVPYVGCSGPRYNETAAGKGSLDNGRTQLSEVWYYFHSLGRPQMGTWVPTNASSPSSSCATTSGAIWYYERTASSVRYGAAQGY